MDNKISVNPILDSRVNNVRITTFEVVVPLMAWVQILTHRKFSRNAQSSRALPTKKLLESANFIPEAWPLNDKGMSPLEFVSEENANKAIEVWSDLNLQALKAASRLNELGIHKEIANRVLSPFIYMKGLITSTEWNNFINLRTHNSTQAETRKVAFAIRDYFQSHPINDVPARQYHVPFIEQGEQFKTQTDFMIVSAARCARVSYLSHDGKRDMIKDIQLGLDLLKDQHMSPFEHVAIDNTYAQLIQHHRTVDVMPKIQAIQGNFDGVIQFRKLVEIPQNQAKIIDQTNRAYNL